MAIHKIVTPNSQKLDDANIATEIKLSSRGLIGEDKKRFNKKVGSNSPFSSLNLSSLAQPGEVLIHLVALGTTEYYGPNLWGDGFSERECRKCHPYFKKFAKWYREHKSYDQEKSYGIVKASAYNDKMHRVELIVALNGNEEAAKRNKGLVADVELEKLASNEILNVSMACFSLYDICSGCKGQFRKREHYCDETTCKKYGGLKNNIGKTFEDGHTLYADSIDPLFYDISYVRNPADRIAKTTGILFKAASKNLDNYLSEVITYRDKIDTESDYRRAKILDINNKLEKRLELLMKLANLENSLEKNKTISNLLFKIFTSIDKNLIYDEIEKLRKKASYKPTSLFEGVLPLSEFKKIFDKKLTNCRIEKIAGNTFNLLKSCPNIYCLLVESPFFVENHKKSNNISDDEFNFLSLRTKKIALIGSLFDGVDYLNNKPLVNTVKKINFDDFSADEKKLGISYALYQLSYLEQNEGKVRPETIIVYNKIFN